MRESFARVRPFAERAVGVALAVVLFRSATSHAGNPFYFLSSVYSYKIVGADLGALAAAALPAVQVALAVCLLLRWGRRGAYLASAVLFVGFTAAQASVLNRGLDISCGCFGAADSLPVGPSTVAVAVSCAVASAVGFVLSPASAGRGGVRCVAPTVPASA